VVVTSWLIFAVHRTALGKSYRRFFASFAGAQGPGLPLPEQPGSVSPDEQS